MSVSAVLAVLAVLKQRLVEEVRHDLRLPLAKSGTLTTCPGFHALVLKLLIGWITPSRKTWNASPSAHWPDIDAYRPVVPVTVAEIRPPAMSNDTS